MSELLERLNYWSGYGTRIVCGNAIHE